jgi:hypothetical protein
MARLTAVRAKFDVAESLSQAENCGTAPDVTWRRDLVRKMVIRRWRWTGVLALLAFASPAEIRIGAQSASQRDQPVVNAPIHHDRGQTVTPGFEGWFKNPDGTISLSFGYMNRNYVEDLDIPLGPDNKIEPGPPDQGQPTHFNVRRNTGVFTVVVPKLEGGERTWTLTSRGQTISIPANLKPEWGIDALKDIANGNTPPVIKFDPAGKTGQGPRGVSTDMNVNMPAPATLNVWVTDDMIRKRQGDGGADSPTRGPALGVIWSKFRGTGRVTFSETTPKLVDGKASSTAMFSEPGDYTLRVLAWDASGPPGPVMAVGFQCCWTNGYVKVHVTK